jgi:pyruvate/2-oxoglutarate dehydrogenase complex dihydrolipoamide acyltransferase (E2) component
VVTNGVQTYNWSQTSGPTVTLSGATSGTPTFTAPPTTAGATLVFSLTVTDTLGSTSAADTVSIGVVKHVLYQLKTAGPVPTPVQLLAATGPPPGGTIVPLSDFNQQSAGLYVASGTLDGNGAIYRLAAHSSSKVAPTSGTNQYKLIRAAGLNAAGAAKVTIKNLILEGTDQLSSLDSYGGLVVQYGSGSHHLRTSPSPASPATPRPLRVRRSRVRSSTPTTPSSTNLILDGYRTSDGARSAPPSSATTTPPAPTPSTGSRPTTPSTGSVSPCSKRPAPTRSPSADMRNNRKAINIEQSIGGTVYNFNSCDFRGTSGAVRRAGHVDQLLEHGHLP